MSNFAIYSTKQFTYDAKTKTFISEASDLQLEFKQIYPDSCDEGLELVSERTGETSKWAVDDIQYSKDHELQAWHLIPINETLRKCPGLKGHKMTIFND